MWLAERSFNWWRNRPPGGRSVQIQRKILWCALSVWDRMLPVASPNLRTVALRALAQGRRPENEGETEGRHHVKHKTFFNWNGTVEGFCMWSIEGSLNWWPNLLCKRCIQIQSKKTLKCFTCKGRPHGEDNSIARGLNEVVARSHLTFWECPQIVGFTYCGTQDWHYHEPKQI
jgi:hypothetical protein